MPEVLQQMLNYVIAIYIRLSAEDGDLSDEKSESNSVVNQRAYIRRFIELRPEFAGARILEFCDDGYSGTNMERPAVRRLLEQVRQRKINCIIVKDMSRFGRDYIVVGDYLEQIFPFLDVRFIAINDSYDSKDHKYGSAGLIDVSFRNVIYDLYSKDLSEKVRSTKKQLAEKGYCVAPYAFFGYQKAPGNKHALLVDEDAAAVVRRIFRLAVEGHGPHEIAKILTQEKVECPAYYLARNGRGSRKNTVDTSRPYDWYGFTVSSMLEKPEYMGHTVNFRSSKKSYRDKRVKNDPSDWLIFENTHEAIVDPETWQLAQQVKRTVRRTDTTGVANPLTGLVFCADCGAKMYNHRGKRKKNGREYSVDFYSCSTYTLTFERETQMCSSHTVSTKALNALILETIRTTASYAIQNKEEFIQKVRSISQVRQQEAAKELKRKVAKERKRSVELDVLIKKLYETYAMGKLEEKRFELLCAEYEKEQAELEQLLASEQAQLDQFHEDTDRASHFLTLAQKYTDFTELTAPMIHEFVEKILVHAPDRSTGERVQEIEIYLNFIGKFEVPMPEPTEEELAAEEKRRQKRIRDHEKYLRQKERKQKIAEGLIVPGEPYQLVCQCCGEPFQSVRPNAKFCKPACREKFYRQEKRKAKENEITQTA